MGENNLTDKDIFDCDINWLNESNLVVAEVTTPSLGVGYELELAESLNKKIICLFRNTSDKKLSAMISGNSYMRIFKYSEMEDITKILSKNII